MILHQAVLLRLIWPYAHYEDLDCTVCLFFCSDRQQYHCSLLRLNNPFQGGNMEMKCRYGNTDKFKNTPRQDKMQQSTKVMPIHHLTKNARTILNHLCSYFAFPMGAVAETICNLLTKYMKSYNIQQ